MLFVHQLHLGTKFSRASRVNCMRFTWGICSAGQGGTVLPREYRARAHVSRSPTLQLILRLHETDMHYCMRTSSDGKLRTCTLITIKWHQTRAVIFSWSGSKINSERKLGRAPQWLVNKRSLQPVCVCTLQSIAGDARCKMRLGSIILFVALCSFTAYYIYEPIPEEIEERWKLMLTNSFFRSLSHLVRTKTVRVM